MPNGNLLSDANKGIVQVDYNHLNLPTRIDFGGGKEIHYQYDARGGKLQRTVKQSGQADQNTWYIGSIMYNDNGLEFIQMQEGRAVPDGGGTFRYEYHYRDHIGNTRLAFSDLNDNGSIDNSEILQVEHYYPFGMGFYGLNTPQIGPEHKYKYGGKELQDAFGLNWYDYGARQYQPDLGRWISIDPMAEKMPMVSSYAYSFNNPTLYQDKDGAIPIIPLLIKAGANGASDMMLQVVMNYYFDDKATSLQEAFNQVNWWQVGRSSAEGLIPWRTPGGRLGKAAVTAIGDVLVNALHEGSNYTQAQALQDFAVGFIGDLAGGGIGELISKYGVQGVASGLRKMNIDASIIRRLTGISGNFTGGLVKNNKADEAADILAKKLGGESRVSFANDPLKREFDAISDAFIAQTKSIGKLGKAFRKQAKATFEAAQESGRAVYYEFTGGAPSQDILNKLTEYARRYDVNLKIDIVD